MIESEEFINEEHPSKKNVREQDVYEKIKLLGTGSFGRAYLVKEKNTGQLYVIKQVDIADLLPQEQETARKQAKILQALSHPNIVKFKQVYGTSKMKLNIVMEYANGGDLSSRIADAKRTGTHFEEAEILSWFTQMCLGIKHIHDRKIIHRDLKGQNIFLTEDDCVKIGDFGVARILENTYARAKTVVGSPYYLSPQIIENKPYSFKTDIWSLGALLFEMCALQPPFTANNIQFLALKIVKGSYSNIPNKYSADLKQLIRWMLNTNANQRPNINQILSSPIINRRIKSFLTESQNVKEFSHTVLHNFNPLKPELKQYEGIKQDGDRLRPPPNLMELEHQNVSQVGNYEAKKYYEEKPKPPSSHTRIKVRPPMSSKRNSKASIQQQGNLADIMQIKPSQLEVQQPIKLPKVPPHNIEKQRPQTPKVITTKKDNKAVENKKNITSGNFCKNKKPLPQQIKQEEKIQLDNVIEIKNTPSSIAQKKTPQRPASKNFIVKKQSKKKIQTKPKKPIAKPKLQGKNKSKEKHLELVSEEAKDKEKVLKEKNTACKTKQKSSQTQSAHKKSKTQQPKQQKKEKEKQIEIQQQILQKDQEIFEEEKYQEDSDDYETQNFQHYSSDQFERTVPTQNKQKADVAEDSVSLELSGSVEKQKTGGKNQSEKNNNFNKMMAEMELINKLVEQANGMAENLPILGSEMPPFNLTLSDTLREDNLDLESENSSEIRNKKEKMSNNKLGQTLNNLDCLVDPGELENLRIVLEEIFGIDNLLYIYNKLQSIIREEGLQFHEQAVIRQIVNSCPQKFSYETVRKHIRHVVCVIVLETKMQFLGNEQ